MLLRLYSQTQRHLRRRLLSSAASSSSQQPALPNKTPITNNNLKYPVLQQQDNNLVSPHQLPFYRKHTSLIILALSATLLTSASLVSKPELESEPEPKSPLLSVIDQTVQKSNSSVKRLVNHIKHTGVAAAVLWQSLWSMLLSANHEVRSGFELRVAAFLADIAAANSTRRAAIVSAGGGAVVDWLIETVAVPRDGCATQAEAARALAYLIADRDVSGAVLGRPNAVPCLLRFIFSCQPKSKKHARRSSFDASDSLKGRSMLVAAIMDIVTSNCENLDKISFHPVLPGNAQLRDVAAAIHVIEEGGMHLDDPQEKEDDEDGGNGMKGLGIKILEGTTVLGFTRHTEPMDLEQSDATHMKYVRETPKTVVLQNKYDTSPEQENLSLAVVPGLWDDLHCQHVAVPFAAWALANWALASAENRSHIQELDQDGCAVMSALSAPERSVKWHGSLVARLLLEDRSLPLNDSVSDWTCSLLSTISHASKSDDIPLIQVALSAFLLSVERCPGAQKVVMEKGLHQMRDTAKRTNGHKDVQEALAKALELLCSGDMQFSLEESHKWSGILLPWVFGKNSSDNIRSSATKILSHILDDYGPLSIPISQGWLTIILSEILSNKTTVKGGTQAKSSNVKVNELSQTQVDQSIILSAAQTANQLAIAVVNTAGKQLGSSAESVESSPLADLLSLDPFSGPLKNLKKDSLPKFHAADSAVATLKGIKALTEVCIGDSLCQEKLADFGVLCLLRRLLLCDDYEKLAAFEAYDASRAVEAQEWAKNGTEVSYNIDNADISSVRVPSTAHIRRHAARLLTVLSLLPKVQKEIVRDEVWCKWLEDCANGKIQGCGDVKIQSYARATLLNVLCNEQSRKESMKNVGANNISQNSKKVCPRYDDMIFLINPELPHWKCLGNMYNQDTNRTDVSPDSEAHVVTGASNDGSPSSSDDTALRNSRSEVPPIDVVFVHGLRGGPYKTWRISEDKSSTKSGLVEKIDQEAGKQGTFWPGEWLSNDFPQARLFTLKYKTNLTQWSGASLPLQEVSSMILEKLVAAGIGNQPVVFVTHSMGGLVVKEMLYRAKANNMENLVNNTIGIVFYSCPHFGSKLADMPWRMGLVLRPAPTIGELRSGSSRLVELNDFVRHLHKKGMLDVLSLCETKVTPIVEGYGGWAFRMEIVPIESAYPGFGELVVLDATDHINSCKPLSRTDPSYTEILEFLHKLKSQYK